MQTSEVIGTVQEKSPVGPATSGSLPAGAVEPVRDASRIQIVSICINGAVDGFSRMVIWLHAYITSSNPRVISGYFLDEVEPVF